MHVGQEKISLIDKINAYGAEINETRAYIQWAHNYIRSVHMMIYLLQHYEAIINNNKGRNTRRNNHQAKQPF
jgi:hypothetical protein